MIKALFAAFCGATKGILRANRAKTDKRAGNTTKVLIALPIFLLVGGGLGVAPLHAEAVPYPENDPVFSVEVPDGWHIKREKGALMLAPDADAAVLLQHVSDVKDADSAKAGLPSLAASAAKTFAMVNAEVVTPATSINVGKFNGFATEYKGKDKEGESAFWQVMIFSPGQDDYYLMTIVCSDKDDTKTTADREKIVQSVKPMSEE
jgi:predicted Zn-dependent protease